MFTQWPRIIIVTIRVLHLAYLAQASPASPSSPAAPTSPSKPFHPLNASMIFTDQMMDGVMEALWHEEYAPKLQDAELDWDRIDRMQNVNLRIESVLIDKELESAPDVLTRAREEFLFRLVPVKQSQDTWREFLRVADSETLSAEYAPFLDAPTETEEEILAARAALCRIMEFGTTNLNGQDCTFQGRSNHFAFNEALQNVMMVAGEVLAPAGTDKVTGFMMILLSLESREDVDQRHEVLMVLAADEPRLLEALDAYIYEFNVGRELKWVV